MSLFHAFMESNAFYLPQILSLVKLPDDTCKLHCKILGPYLGCFNGWDIIETAEQKKIHSNAKKVEKF
jgi:hypothetical protein